jgi:hypothetical protein
MEFKDFLYNQKNNGNIELKNLAKILFEDNEIKIANYGHYFTISIPEQRLEVTETGYIELYGSNAGVNAKTLIDWFYSKNINFNKNRTV